MFDHFFVLEILKLAKILKFRHVTQWGIGCPNEVWIKFQYSFSQIFPSICTQIKFDEIFIQIKSKSNCKIQFHDFFRQINCKWNCRIQFDGIFRQIKSKWSCSMYVYVSETLYFELPILKHNINSKRKYDFMHFMFWNVEKLFH